MSILIKGRNMPENCQECVCLNDEYFYCQVVGRKPSDENIVNKRPDWCPLVLVPDHGRLFDADEFLKRAIGTKCFRGDYALMLEELVGESTTIIEAEENEA